MSDLPPPPEPPSGWPQPGAPAPGYGGYAAPPPPPGAGPWGTPTNYGVGPGMPGYGVQKANFGQRLVAFIIDVVILNVMLVPAWIVLFTGDTEWVPCRVEDGDRVFDEGPSNAACEEPTDETVALTLGVGALGLVGYLVYVGRMEGRTGATLGARAVGIKVVDMTTGQPIGGGRAIGRWIGSLISRAVCLLGYLWMLWDDQSQTWHDKMTSAVVVRT